MTVKVLIVDDSKFARMGMSKILAVLRPDWQRTGASSAEQALAQISTGVPDIVLLDFNMPGRDGLDLAAELSRSHPGIAIAVISGNRQVEVVNRAEGLGAHFLPKPINQAALAAFPTVPQSQRSTI